MSKILARYAETGSIKPGSIGGLKSRLFTGDVDEKFDDSKTMHAQNSLFVSRIREKLARDGTYKHTSLPGSHAMTRVIDEDGSDNDYHPDPADEKGKERRSRRSLDEQ